MAAKKIVMKRRREVLVFHNAKYTSAEIADLVGFSVRTVDGDIAWWKRQEEYKVKIGNPVMEILINYNQEYRDLIQLQKKTEDDNVKKACITGRTDITTKIKYLLQESNNMDKAPERHEILAVHVTPERVREILEAKKRRQIEDELIEST